MKTQRGAAETSSGNTFPQSTIILRSKYITHKDLLQAKKKKNSNFANKHHFSTQKNNLPSTFLTSNSLQISEQSYYSCIHTNIADIEQRGQHRASDFFLLPDLKCTILHSMLDAHNSNLLALLQVGIFRNLIY